MKLSGPEFDREYMRTMVRDHERDISDFKREASAGRNPDVKNFASEALPKLEQQMKLARETEREVGATASLFVLGIGLLGTALFLGRKRRRSSANPLQMKCRHASV